MMYCNMELCERRQFLLLNPVRYTDERCLALLVIVMQLPDLDLISLLLSYHDDCLSVHSVVLLQAFSIL